MALDVKVRKIVGEISENRHFRRPHSHLKPSVQRTPAIIRTNLILLETTIPALHFGLYQCWSIVFQIFVVGSETQTANPLPTFGKRKAQSC